MTTTDENSAALPELERSEPAPTITDVTPSLAAIDPVAEAVPEPQNAERQGEPKTRPRVADAPPPVDPPTGKADQQDWWDPLYYDQDADLDTNTGTVKTLLTRRLPAPTRLGEETSKGEGGDSEGDQAGPGASPIPGRTPPRPEFPPRSLNPAKPQADPESELEGGEEESAAERINDLLKKAVVEALDERAAEAAQGEGEGDPQQRGRWSKLRPHTHRRVPAPASAAPKLPNFGKAGGEADSWTRGLRARRIWGLRYLPAVASIWYLDMRGGINPFLASSVVEPAGMIGSIYAFTLGPAAWWATQFAKGKAYATRVRAVLALSASGVGYMGGPTTVGWLYNHGIDASMWTPFGAGIATTAALWWFLDRRTYRLPWLFGWVPLIPTSAVAYATASFVIDF